MYKYNYLPASERACPFLYPWISAFPFDPVPIYGTITVPDTVALLQYTKVLKAFAETWASSTMIQYLFLFLKRLPCN